MSKNLMEQLLNAAKKSDMGYGIHNNVVILSVDNTVRKTKDKSIVKRNNFTKFGKLNDKGLVVSEKEVSWFNLDPSSDFVYGNFFSQLDQMIGILYCYYDKDADDNVVEETFDSIFEALELEDITDIEEAVKNKKVSLELMDAISEAYITLLDGKTGLDSEPLRLKLSYDSKGKYLQNPRFDPFTEPMSLDTSESKLKMTRMDEENKAKSMVTAPKLGSPINI